MKILNLPQGSPQWHAHRASHWNASEAPAMLGESPHISRSQLLHRLATGISEEVDAATQKRFDNGHKVEALLRPLAEQQLGEPLHAFVGVADFNPKLSASFDGCTFVGDITLECKLLNERLRAAFADMESISPEHRERAAGGCLPIDYRIQMEQQVRVAEADRALFMTGELRPDGTLGDVFSCWYYPNDALWASIQAGWTQFDADLATYQPREAEPPAPTGRAPETLPALRIEITGAVTASNLADFKTTALGAIRSVNRELSTDQQFADAEQAVKWCAEVESRIKAAKEHALSQTATIDELFRTLDDVSAEARKVRLDLEKLVTRRKEEIKGEMVASAKAAYQRHEDALRQDTGGAWIVLTPPDFGGAIKGKRSVSAMQDALDTTLANAKIVADESARKIRAALQALDEAAKGFEHLFADRLSFISKAPEDVRALVRDRITEHKAAEERRAAELAERERARIRAEEEARAREQARREQEAEDALISSIRARANPVVRQEQPTLTDNVRPMPTRASAATAPAPSGPPTLKLGQINARLAPLSITAEGLAQLGFPVVATDRGAKLYRDSDWIAMVDAITAHLEDNVRAGVLVA